LGIVIGAGEMEGKEEADSAVLALELIDLFPVHNWDRGSNL